MATMVLTQKSRYPAELPRLIMGTAVSWLLFTAVMITAHVLPHAVTFVLALAGGVSWLLTVASARGQNGIYRILTGPVMSLVAIGLTVSIPMMMFIGSIGLLTGLGWMAVGLFSMVLSWALLTT